MFRVKVAAIFGGLALVVTAVAVFVVPEPLAREAEERVRARVARGARLVEKEIELEARNLVDVVNEVAGAAEFADLLAQSDAAPAPGAPEAAPAAPAKSRRARAFEAAEGHSARMAARGKKPDLFAVIDRDGKVLARDLDIMAMHGDDLKGRYPSVGLALSGQANKDVWNFENRLMQVGIAPVRAADQTVLGAVAVGFVVTAADARAVARDYGTELAFFLDAKVHATSFVVPGTESADGKATEDVSRVQALAAELYGGRGLARDALAAQKTSDAVTLQLGEEIYVAKVGAVQNATNRQHGFVVLTSLTSELIPAKVVRRNIAALGFVALLIVLGAIAAVIRHFMKGVDKIELGVSEVISGNLEYEFESFEEFEGLANALNVMLARLLGRPEPGAEEGEGGEAGTLIVTAASGTQAEVAELAREAEEAHYQRIFQEYCAARRSLGHNLDDVTRESFVQRVRANEAMLRGRHQCRMVRFVVQQQGGQVSLRPVPIP